MMSGATSYKTGQTEDSKGMVSSVPHTVAEASFRML